VRLVVAMWWDGGWYWDWVGLDGVLGCRGNVGTCYDVE